MHININEIHIYIDICEASYTFHRTPLVLEPKTTIFNICKK